ncbi:hypothetical protein BH23PSE2_BH23PSE2_04050 [soil metagenome]
MNNNSRPRLAVAIPAFLAASLFAGLAYSHAINGAIYTSTADHSQVNANLYASKELVYLNGGPSNSQCNGGKLTDGEYYFQVTNPSGSVLLSTTGIAARKFAVLDGVIAANLGDTTLHPNGGVSACGSLAIRLFPYDDTPNNGGVYKAWITRTSDFHAACGAIADCGLDGFVPGHTKTDNFRVGQTPVVPVEGAVEAFKFYDANANGIFDAGDTELEGWKMTLESLSQGVNSTKFTEADGTATFPNLTPDVDYTVEEGIPVESNWVHSATIYLGHDGSPVNPAGPLTVIAGETTTVAFGNYCTIPSNGRTLGFWSNKNGQALIGGDDRAMLNALNLRKKDGTDFVASSNSVFRTWLLAGDAVNMAYMLSVQLSAMALNVHNGFVDGGGFYVPAGMTINQLMAAADASLLMHGVTLAGHPQRAYQESLKNWLDALNNGAGVLSPEPCDFTFED